VLSKEPEHGRSPCIKDDPRKLDKIKFLVDPTLAPAMIAAGIICKFVRRVLKAYSHTCFAFCPRCLTSSTNMHHSRSDPGLYSKGTIGF
jgi:hypothetical protein